MTLCDPTSPFTDTDPQGNGSEEETIKMYNSMEEFEKNLPETVTMLTSECGSKVSYLT